MNIKELEKLRRLKATPKIMRMAANDVPIRKNLYGWEKIIYKYGLYMRCHVQNGILVVAIFLAEHLRAGGRNPAYEVFIHNKSRQFITYDSRENKWRSAMVNHLDMPVYTLYSGKWISQAESERIKKYLGGEHGGYAGLLDFQAQIREDALTARHKKETDAWDLDLMQIPKLPKDWARWVSKVGIPQNYIYYHYNKKGVDTGYCTYCEMDVSVKQPRHNKAGICPRCRHKITFKSIGRAGLVVTDKAIMYLMQRCKDGLVIRYFTGFRKYSKGGYKLPERSCQEVRRVICDSSGRFLRAYEWGRYKMKSFRWILSGECSPYWSDSFMGRTYGKTLPDLAKRELRLTGLPHIMKEYPIFDPERYLTMLKAMPYLEKIAKAKLPRLMRECLASTYTFRDCIHDPQATELTKLLGINTQELKRLRGNNGGMRFLAWLKYERKAGKAIPDHVISWFCSERITAKALKFIRSKMSMVQIYNYVRRQMAAYVGATSGYILTTWADYLSMARRLKMDTTDAIVFRVNKLVQRHNELVELCDGKGLSLEADRIADSYPHVDEICLSLKDKYEYAGDVYSVVAPTCIEDILLEGQNLHHCLGRSDRYWERIERREAYVLFLRKTAEPDKSYYSLEVEPNGTIRQKRTMYDRQHEDIEDATKFLAEWQTVISKRLEAADLELAKKSRILREQDYAELREKKAIIHVGDYAGQLLADVLLADLMENTALPKAA